jgi:hypothetical protein
MIYLINSYGKEVVGHFWIWDIQFRKAFRELNLKHAYINPSANIAAKEDTESEFGYYLQTNSDKDFISQSVSLIQENIAIHGWQEVILVFSYLAQFSEKEIDYFISQIMTINVKVSIAGISNLSDVAMMNKRTSKRYLMQDYFNQLKIQRILWVFEKKPKEYECLSFIRELPDFIESKKSLGNRSNDISFFGSLNAYRGITEILLIALFNPKLRIYIKGHGFARNRVWRPIKCKRLIFTSWKQKPLVSLPMNFFSIIVSFLIYLPNVKFSSEPFKTETDLDDAIMNSGSLFFCAKLQFGSGIVAKSLYSEIPVIWLGQGGHAFEMLNKNYPIGRISYSDMFIPNKIWKKYNLIKEIKSSPPFSWETVRNSIYQIHEFMK